MAKLFNPGNFSQQFGESFIRTLEMERKMRQDQEQFNRKMQFENRQLGLYTDIAKERNRLEAETPTETVTGDIYNRDFSKKLWEAPPVPVKEPKMETEGEFENPKTGTIWRWNETTQEGIDTKIPYDPNKSRSNININMPPMPKPDKWANFGKYISEAKNTQVFDTKENKMVRLEPEEINTNWERAKNEAFSTLLPNAYNFYKKNFKDTKNEEVSNHYFLARVKKGLEDDEITIEEAQDLIDFSAFRSDLFKINK